MMSMEAEIRALRAEISSNRTTVGPPSRSPSQLSSEVKSEAGDSSANAVAVEREDKVNGNSTVSTRPTVEEWKEEMSEMKNASNPTDEPTSKVGEAATAEEIKVRIKTAEESKSTEAGTEAKKIKL